MGNYTFSSTIEKNDRNTLALDYVETVWAIKMGEGYTPTNYGTEDDAVDEAENLYNETGGSYWVTEVEVYEHQGLYYFFHVN